MLLGFFENNRKSLLSFRDVIGVAKSFGLQYTESDFTARRLEIRDSANYQDLLRTFFFPIAMQHPLYVPMWIYTS